MTTKKGPFYDDYMLKAAHESATGNNSFFGMLGSIGFAGMLIVSVRSIGSELEDMLPHPDSISAAQLVDYLLFEGLENGFGNERFAAWLAHSKECEACEVMRKAYERHVPKHYRPSPYMNFMDAVDDIRDYLDE
ncbi:MAG: hypothetical protein ACOZAO_04300 [Patescibacteria group bacterium]